jgi:hypothetical protein
LAKTDEISSTEKLLELIRNKNQPEFDDQNLSPHRQGAYRLKSFFSNPISFMKAISVGVDLGHDDLKMVKMQRISDHKFEMLDYARVPFDPDISRENPEFHQFL